MKFYELAFKKYLLLAGYLQFNFKIKMKMKWGYNTNNPTKRLKKIETNKPNQNKLIEY